MPARWCLCIDENKERKAHRHHSKQLKIMTKKEFPNWCIGLVILFKQTESA